MAVRIRDTTLFVATLTLTVLGVLSALEDSVPGFIAGIGAALTILFLLVSRRAEQ